MAGVVAFYLLTKTMDEQGYIGAVLVTDEVGTPQEFRVTMPVKPSALQRQLYGESLIPHIGIDLCGKPLLKALNRKPHLLLVNRLLLLAIADTVSYSVAFIERVGESMRVTTEDGTTAGKLYKLQTPSNRFQPLSVTYPSSNTEKSTEEAHQRLEYFFKGVDLLEPFQRIDVALKALAESDARFR